MIYIINTGLLFASVKEGGSGADVRPIPNRDNQDAGTSWRIQINGYGPEKKRIPDNHDIEIQALNIGNSKSIVGTSGNDTLRGFNGVNLMYGYAGRDLMYGFGGDDVMFGGQDEDHISGQEGDDELYGNAGNDFVSGWHGNDTLTGGLGIDTLVGGIPADEKDVFVLQKGMPYRGDQVDDFQVGTDRIGVLRRDFSTLGNFSFRNGVWPPMPASQGAWIQWQGQDMIFLDRINASQLSTDIFQYL